ncbi:MAG: choice-of-anchor D domain-containing protein, partial [Acidobacteria bacterium]|nr:choice-of-anchor D domain-containing protein [Acidobacteriota bacterium]
IAPASASLAFGPVTANQSLDQDLIVRNNGGSVLKITPAFSNSLFRLISPAAIPINVDPKGQATLKVRFTPTAAGPQAGTLTLASNDPLSPSVSIALSGTGIGSAAPAITVTPATLDLGSAAVGSATAPKSVTITNSGDAPLNAALAITGSFTVTPRTLPTIAARASTTVQIAFNPASATPVQQTGTLTVSAAGIASGSVALAGTVTAPPGPFLEIRTGTPSAVITSWDFGAVAANAQGAVILQVNNKTPSTLNVTVGFTNTKFSLGLPGSATFPIGGGSFEYAQILFRPTDSGVQTGSVTFSANGQTTTIALKGNGSGGTGGTTLLALTAAAGWPNGRVSNQLPSLAIDGSTGTYTWTTESFNSASPSYLGVSLGASASVSRLRIYKDNDAGGPGLIAKNLTIEYTTSSPSVALASRTWTPVSGLTNGFNGTELMTATSVNSNGTVTADNHVSQTSGWASLSFTPVNATGIRIGFSNATPISVNHYRVYEVQLYGQANTVAVPFAAGTPSKQGPDARFDRVIFQLPGSSEPGLADKPTADVSATGTRG